LKCRADEERRGEDICTGERNKLETDKIINKRRGNMRWKECSGGREEEMMPWPGRGGEMTGWVRVKRW
jgi:hypothetical protein